MDLVKRNAEIVALVKAGKIPRHKIAARYRLSVTSIARIAIKQGVCVRTPDPEKVRLARELINRGMPSTHVAQAVGLYKRRLRHLLEKEGLYAASRPNGKPWSDYEVLVLRRHYGKTGCSLQSIASKLGRTSKAISSTAAQLGCAGRLNPANPRRKAKLNDNQRAEAIKRMPMARAAGPSPGVFTYTKPPHKVRVSHFLQDCPGKARISSCIGALA